MTPEEYIKAYTRGCSNELEGGGYHEWLTPENALAAVELAREEMKAKQVVTIKCEKKSPITGGEMQLIQEKSSVKFRGEEVSFVKKYYHCVDSGQEFTDTELDNDNMWAIFRAYWERKGFEHFYDIDGYREEQEPASPCENCEGNGLPGTCASISSLDRCPLEYNKEPISEDFESEWKRYCDSKGGGAVTMNVKDVAKHFANWQKEQGFNDFARLRKSWYEEGRIDGKFEGLSDDEKYQQGFHDAKEQMMKDALEARSIGIHPLEKTVSYEVKYPNEFPSKFKKVKVIIIKE